MDWMESSFFCFVELTCPLPSGVCCVFYSSLFFSVFQEWHIDKKKGHWTVDYTLPLSVYLPWCALLCVLLIDWPVMDRLVVGTSQYCQVLVFLSEGWGGEGEWGWKKDRKRSRGREGKDIDQVPCTSNSTFTWPSKLLASSPQYTADVHASRAFFLPSSLHCPFVSAPCGFVRVCMWACMSVCVCVCVCMHAWAADKA